MVNIKLVNKENDLVFLSQLDFKSNITDECLRGNTDNANKLCKVGDYLANFVLMEPKEIR
jgi:hypothetical protein